MINKSSKYFLKDELDSLGRDLVSTKNELNKIKKSHINEINHNSTQLISALITNGLENHLKHANNLMNDSSSNYLTELTNPVVKNILNQYNINYEKLKLFYPLYRHFKIIESEKTIKKLYENIYEIKSRKTKGILGKSHSIETNIWKKLIKDNNQEILNPIYCRYHRSGPCSVIKEDSKYYYIVPIGEFELFQSTVINDIGQFRLSDIAQKKEHKQNINYIEDIFFNTYKNCDHTYSNYEVLMYVEKYLLIGLDIEGVI